MSTTDMPATDKSGAVKFCADCRPGKPCFGHRMLAASLNQQGQTK